MRPTSFLLVGLVSLACYAVASGETIDLKTHWDISTAWQSKTDFRQKICLNGLWQFSSLADAGTEPDGAWGYLKVPGGTRLQFVVYNDQRQVDEATTDKMRQAPYGLYRRTFVLPEGAKGKRVCLLVDHAWYSATIYVNGKEIKTIVPSESLVDREVDISDAVVPGENEIKILVCNVPREREERSESNAGICDDVWLEIMPAGTRFDSVRVATSVEGQGLDLTVRLSNPQAGATMTLAGELYEHNTPAKSRGRKVMDIPSQNLTVGQDGVATVKVDLSSHWSELSLWNFENPALYELVLDLGSNGQVADQIMQRIGLRETKIVGHEFFLNGQKTHVRDCYKFLEKYDRRRFAEFTDERVFRYRLRAYKQAGWNICHTFSAYEPYLDNLVDMMDEEGLMYYPLIIGVSAYQASDKDPEMFRMVKEAIDHYYNHPAVVLWSMFTTGNFRTDEDIRNPWAWTLRYGPPFMTPSAQEVMDGHEVFYKFMKKCDPTRPTMFGSLTNFGDGITGFYYPNFCTSTQELMSWPVKWWATKDRKAQWALEGTYRLADCWGNVDLQRRKDLWEDQAYENAARTLGPAAYISL